MPIELTKVLAVAAIAQQWSPPWFMLPASLGIVWLLFAITGVMNWIEIHPHAVIRGIQVLGVLLAVEALKMLSSWWLLGLISLL